MTNDPWFWAFVVCLVLSICLGVMRDVHYRSISQKYTDILRLMRGTCKQIAELKQLTLDIEQRSKLDRIEAQLQRAGSSHGTHIDINGGRVNQVGGKIENE